MGCKPDTKLGPECYGWGRPLFPVMQPDRREGSPARAALAPASLVRGTPLNRDDFPLRAGCLPRGTAVVGPSLTLLGLSGPEFR